MSIPSLTLMAIHTGTSRANPPSLTHIATLTAEMLINVLNPRPGVTSLNDIGARQAQMLTIAQLSLVSDIAEAHLIAKPLVEGAVLGSQLTGDVGRVLQASLPVLNLLLVADLDHG